MNMDSNVLPQNYMVYGYQTYPLAQNPISIGNYNFAMQELVNQLENLKEANRILTLSNEKNYEEKVKAQEELAQAR